MRSADGARLPRAPLGVGARGLVVTVLLLLGALAALALGLGLRGLVPHSGGAEIAREFFAAALNPALTREATGATESPLLVEVAGALWRTILFAAAAMGLSLAAGLPLGACASERFFGPEVFGRGRAGRIARPLLAVSRVVIALMRSVHELLWAVVFLAAFGLNTFAAVVAIAIPYAGTLAKVFSEMLDEGAPSGSRALHALGAGPLEVFLVGVVPPAVPDLVAYAFYRFECALRSSAVLGFFGYATSGYFMQIAFGDLHYREVWTHLYALILLVVSFEAWSGALRRRLVE